MTDSALTQRLKDQGLRPHQVAFVDGVLRLVPPGRCLLADPVGMGKASACASLLSELESRKGPEFRALVLTPGALTHQWANAIKLAGGAAPVVVDAREYRNLQAHTELNPWAAPGVYVVSTDFAKKDPQRAQILALAWDFAALDEVHLGGRGDSATLREALLRGLWESALVDTAVGLSATGNLPVGWASPTEPLVLQRSISEMLDWDGRALGARREVTCIEFKLTSEEVSLYRSLGRALGGGGTSPARLLLKRVLSSTLGLDDVLRSQLEQGGQQPRQASLFDTFEDSGSRGTSVQLELFSTSPLLAAKDCRQLMGLLNDLRRDSKLEACAQLVSQLEADAGNEHLVVFTDFLRTAEYIAEVVGDERPNTWLLTGEMSFEEGLEAVTGHRREGGLLVTTSASEGLDLGYARSAIHYDLPWNPAALARRFGRLERYGSPHAKHFHYLLVDERTMSKELATRLTNIEEEIDIEEIVEHLLGLLGAE